MLKLISVFLLISIPYFPVFCREIKEDSPSEAQEQKIALGIATKKINDLEKKLEQTSSVNNKYNSSLDLSMERIQQILEENNKLRLKINEISLLSSSNTLLNREKNGKKITEILNELRISRIEADELRKLLQTMLDNIMAYSPTSLNFNGDSQRNIEFQFKKIISHLKNNNDFIKIRQLEFSMPERAKIISIKNDMNLIVLNIGLKDNLKLGQCLSLSYKDIQLGKVYVIDVRKKISGVICDSTLEVSKIKLGELIQIKTIQ